MALSSSTQRLECPLDMDKNTDNVKITYSCEAIKLASTVAPMQTLGWIELLQ